MIIYGKPEVPIQRPSEPVTVLYEFPVFQSRQDYVEVFGKEPPPPNPMIRRKHWLDPKYGHLSSDNGEEVIYTVLAVDPVTNRPKLNAEGKPYLTYISVPAYLAGQVNIPYGTANEYPPNTPIMRFSYQPPVRQLHPDEELAMSPGPMGGPIVINRQLMNESVTEYLRQIRELLDKIESKIRG